MLMGGDAQDSDARSSAARSGEARDNEARGSKARGSDALGDDGQRAADLGVAIADAACGCPISATRCG